ncbi:MAG: Gfo/Idh/MocA family oxidoreductase, partial [Bacteroidales bacterium]|nr:Gfo/Idh/MocA family oxidoreductase [Bacteroidales bacterium]
PDRLHVPLALRSVRCGWHVLLEKPVVTCERDYLALMEASAAAGVHVGVCLEMRFHPYFRRIKEIYDSGILGQVLGIDHTEHIGPDRMAHTFVRGLWSKSEDSGPIFLSKCCHDADFILWLTGLEPVEVRSSGALTKFVFDPDAPAFCVDCNRTGCPYSAVSLYRDRREWIDGFDVPDGSSLSEVIDAELRGGRYGRCVWHCDNNVNDMQDVDVVLSGRDAHSGNVAFPLSMHLDGTSLLEGRTTVIRGSAATLTADGGIIKVEGNGPVLTEDFTSLAGEPLHAGADRALVEDFFAAISAGGVPSASLESAYQAHRICWLAG